MSVIARGQVFTIFMVVVSLVAISVLSRSGRLDRRTFIIGLAVIPGVLWLGLGIIYHLSAAQMMASGWSLAWSVPLSILGWFAFWRVAWPGFYRAPGGAGAILRGLSWDENAVLAVLRAEDPAVIAEQPDEDEVYSDAARRIYAAGRPTSLADTASLVTETLELVIGSPGMVRRGPARRAAKALVKLAQQGDSNAQSDS